MVDKQDSALDTPVSVRPERKLPRGKGLVGGRLRTFRGACGLVQLAAYPLLAAGVIRPADVVRIHQELEQAARRTPPPAETPDWDAQSHQELERDYLRAVYTPVYDRLVEHAGRGPTESSRATELYTSIVTAFRAIRAGQMFPSGDRSRELPLLVDHEALLANAPAYARTHVGVREYAQIAANPHDERVMVWAGDRPVEVPEGGYVAHVVEPPDSVRSRPGRDRIIVYDAAAKVQAEKWGEPRGTALGDLVRQDALGPVARSLDASRGGGPRPHRPEASSGALPAPGTRSSGQGVVRPPGEGPTL